MKKLGNNFNIQKIDNPKYLTMHVAGLNIQYNNNNLNIYTLPASQGPFYYQVKYNWNKQKTINYMLNNKINNKLNKNIKLIKFRGNERKLLKKLYKNKSKKNSIFDIYLKL